MSDPRFDALQHRHDERGPAIRARIAIVRIGAVAMAPWVLVAHVVLGLKDGLRGACGELRSLWIEAPRILLERDAARLRALVHQETLKVQRGPDA